MKRQTFLSFTLISLISLSANAAMAQNPTSAIGSQKCEGPVYMASQLSHPAELLSRPTPEMIQEARARNIHGRVVLSAVLCRSGTITDIQVIEGLPAGMTESVIEALRRIEFRPAEKEGQAVSQHLRVEYNFHFLGERRPPAKEPLAGRYIDSVEISAPRSFAGVDLFSYMKTRPGQVYNAGQLAEDFRVLLTVGHFDVKGSRLLKEEGERGGISIFIELKEAKQE